MVMCVRERHLLVVIEMTSRGALIKIYRSMTTNIGGLLAEAVLTEAMQLISPISWYSGSQETC